MNRAVIAALFALVAAGAGWAAYEMRGGGESAPASAASLEALTVGEMADLQLAEGRPALPTLPLTRTDGSMVTLADYRGKLLLVNFWAEWCAPCIHEMPTLDRLQAALGGGDFLVLPIAVDRAGPAHSQTVLERLGIRHLTTLGDAKMALMAALGLQGLPASLIIDREGREVARYIGPAEWDSPETKALIRALLAEPTPAR